MWWNKCNKTSTEEKELKRLREKIGLASEKEIQQRQFEEAYEKRLQEIENEKQKEKYRIEVLSCPSCSSIDKRHVVHRKDNGILGPGYASWVVNEYYLCNNCGTHFSDLNKSK